MIKKDGVQILIIDPTNKKILLLKRSGDSSFLPGKWCLPGGKLERGESFKIAANRELYEETGLTGSLWHLGSSYKDPAWRVECFVGTFSSERVCVQISQKEHSEYEWVHFNEVLSLDITEVDRDFIEQYSKIDV